VVTLKKKRAVQPVVNHEDVGAGHGMKASGNYGGNQGSAHTGG